MLLGLKTGFEGIMSESYCSDTREICDGNSAERGIMSVWAGFLLKLWIQSVVDWVSCRLEYISKATKQLFQWSQPVFKNTITFLVGTGRLVGCGYP